MGAVRGAVLQFERRGFIPCPLSFLLPLDGICHFLWEVLFHACSLRIPLLVVSSFAGFARLRGAYALSSFFQNIRPYLIGFTIHTIRVLLHATCAPSHCCPAWFSPFMHGIRDSSRAGFTPVPQGVNSDKIHTIYQLGSSA